MSKKIKQKQLEEFFKDFVPKENTVFKNPETSRRVTKTWQEILSGYEKNPSEILSRRFFEKNTYQKDLVVVADIPFYSVCEHHLLPFFGKVSIGYVPGEFVVGLSKFSRLVECFARRLQVQERMTKDIAESIMKFTNCQGSGVKIQGLHTCMAMRGVNRESQMKTLAFRGCMTDEYHRQAFLREA